MDLAYQNIHRIRNTSSRLCLLRDTDGTRREVATFRCHFVSTAFRRPSLDIGETISTDDFLFHQTVFIHVYWVHVID